jgi:hypothetical protein
MQNKLKQCLKMQLQTACTALQFCRPNVKSLVSILSSPISRGLATTYEATSLSRLIMFMLRLRCKIYDTDIGSCTKTLNPIVLDGVNFYVYCQ